MPSRFMCMPSLKNSGCSSESKACSLSQHHVRPARQFANRTGLLLHQVVRPRNGPARQAQEDDPACAIRGSGRACAEPFPVECGHTLPVCGSGECVRKISTELALIVARPLGEGRLQSVPVDVESRHAVGGIHEVVDQVCRSLDRTAGHRQSLGRIRKEFVEIALVDDAFEQAAAQGLPLPLPAVERTAQSSNTSRRRAAGQ